MSVPALPGPDPDAPALPAGDPCADCGGMCCSFRLMNIAFRGVDDLDRVLEPEEAARATIARGGIDQLLKESGDLIDAEWYIAEESFGMALSFECNHLTEDGRCGVYEDRPEMCSQHRCAVLRGRESLPDFKEARGRDGAEHEVVEEVTEAVYDEIEKQEGWTR